MGLNRINRTRRKAVSSLLLFLFLFAFPGCKGPFSPSGSVEIVDAKMSAGIDADRRPVEPTSEFPGGTATVYCWFSWKGAKPGVHITARWYYTSGDIHILDYPITLTRVEDSGALTLRMPPGKTLPPGSYRVDFEANGKVLKSAPFVILTSPQKTSPG